MSNPVFTFIVLEGGIGEVRSLYGKMKRLQERKKPLVDNSFHEPKRWLGNLVVRLGEDCNGVYCRGTWDSLRMAGNRVLFHTETAGKPPFDLLKMLLRYYPSLQFFFETEGDDWDAYLTNDAEGRYFSSRYVVDCEPDMEYFDTIDAAANHLSAFTGERIAPTWEKLCQAADDWNESHEDSDWPVSVKQIEVIHDDELW